MLVGDVGDLLVPALVEDEGEGVDGVEPKDVEEDKQDPRHDWAVLQRGLRGGGVGGWGGASETGRANRVRIDGGASENGTCVRKDELRNTWGDAVARGGLLPGHFLTRVK